MKKTLKGMASKKEIMFKHSNECIPVYAHNSVGNREAALAYQATINDALSRFLIQACNRPLNVTLLCVNYVLIDAILPHRI